MQTTIKVIKLDNFESAKNVSEKEPKNVIGMQAHGHCFVQVSSLSKPINVQSILCYTKGQVSKPHTGFT